VTPPRRVISLHHTYLGFEDMFLLPCLSTHKQQEKNIPKHTSSRYHFNDMQEYGSVHGTRFHLVCISPRHVPIGKLLHNCPDCTYLFRRFGDHRCCECLISSIIVHHPLLVSKRNIRKKTELANFRPSLILYCADKGIFRIGNLWATSC